MIVRAMAAIACVLIPLNAAEFYVSPKGTPVGDGSAAAPWDLQTALSQQSAVHPGDTVWLRGGVYRGTFISTLSGTAANPIVVRSYPGEWARVDGAGATTLLNALPFSGSASCAFPAFPPLAEGSTVLVDSEHLRLTGKNGNSFTCVRGWDGSPVSSHARGADAVRLGNIIESEGSYVWWWGFEITHSSPASRLIAPELRGAGLNFTAAGVGNKAINMVIHDVGHPAIGFWNQSEGGEIYGSIMWGNGIYDPSFGDRKTLSSMSRGSAVYAENVTGVVYITDAISFRNITNALHVSATNGAADNFILTGNIAFNNATGELFANGGDVHPQRNLRVVGNYTYVRAEDGTNAARMGYSLQGDMVFQDNYLVGGLNPALLVNNWSDTARILGNTVVARTSLVAYEPGSAAMTWDANVYYSPRAMELFGFGGRPRTFEEWRKLTGFDRTSTLRSSRPPDAVFIRPNKYETGRAHVVVYNWSLAPAVKVNLSQTLMLGARYEIRDVQDYFGPAVASGVYDGQPIEITLTPRAPTRLVGAPPTVPATHTLPEFGAFVVMPPQERPRSSRPRP